MRIQDLLSEAGALGTAGSSITGAIGGAGAGVGQAMKVAALKGLGLGNTADQFQQKHAIGAHNYANAAEYVKQLGIKQGMDFEMSPGQKVKITRVDATGASYVDPNTGLEQILGANALKNISQRQQAVQQVAQMQQQQKQKPPGASSTPVAPAGV